MTCSKGRFIFYYTPSRVIVNHANAIAKTVFERRGASRYISRSFRPVSESCVRLSERGRGNTMISHVAGTVP